MKVSAIFSGIVTLAAALTLTACSHDNAFIGTWTSVHPDNITAELPAASTATSLVSLQFIQGDSNRNGSVVLSSIVDITQAVRSNIEAVDEPYEASISATTNIGGTWTYDGDDDDELILSFDLNTLNVNVDRNGVSFSQNLLTGAQQPVVDSLTDATALAWQKDISAAMRKELGRFHKIDDIKVSKDGTLSIEIQRPEAKMHFRRVE